MYIIIEFSFHLNVQYITVFRHDIYKFNLREFYQLYLEINNSNTPSH